MMKNILLFLMMFLAFACNQNTGADDVQFDTSMNKNGMIEKANRDEQVDLPTEDLDGCYWNILDRDTLVVILKQEGQNISGKMTFDNYQKDGSSGVVNGILDNGIIKLWYEFESEGMQSIMQIYLKKQDNQLIRGSGDMKVIGDSAYYKDISNIDYNGQLVYNKTNCMHIPSKYK